MWPCCVGVESLLPCRWAVLISCLAAVVNAPVLVAGAVVMLCVVFSLSIMWS